MCLWIKSDAWQEFGPFSGLKFNKPFRMITDDAENVITNAEKDHWVLNNPEYLGINFYDPIISHRRLMAVCSPSLLSEKSMLIMNLLSTFPKMDLESTLLKLIRR